MSLTSPLGLVALAAIPAVLLLHMFRRRLRQRRVAGLFLWSEHRLTADAGRKRARLLQTPSLWLEMLAAAVLALWLSGPVFGGLAAEHVVVVLDDHAALGARDATGSARDRVLEALRERTSLLSSEDRVTVLVSGERPAVLLGPMALPAELEPAFARWQPRQPGHDPLPTVNFAREIAGASGEVWWCTDRPQPAAGSAVNVLARGRPGPNAAIASADRFANEEGEQLRMTILGFGGLQSTELRIWAGERELFSRRVSLLEGTAQVDLQLPPQLGEVRIELSPDALAIDNEALLLPPPTRQVGVCDLLAEAVREGLRLDEVLAAQSDWRAVTDPRQAQLVLSAAPGQPVPGQLELVVQTGPITEQQPRQAWPGPFLIDHSAELMDGVQLQGVVWVSGPLEPPGRLLVAAGTQALCTIESADDAERVWLNLDAGAGNLTRAPDWPILFANLFERARRQVPGPLRAEVLMGTEAGFRREPVTADAPQSLELLAPDGSREPGRGLRIVGWWPQMPGRHSVRDAEDREVGAYAVRFFDAGQSDLSAASTVTVEALASASAVEGMAAPGDWERRLLALLLLGLVVGDWWLLARGRQ
ncbi:MAG: BatA domain-containing protein [Planctomycetota bacterium]|nr:BatA domain-containing protein [Planctomycetota bacterium]